jgi:chemotaxis-related protein WspD
MAENGAESGAIARTGLSGREPGSGDCWNRIGVGGDRTCPELERFVHCRNCPVFTAAARTFFDRPAPEGYLADWARWLASTTGDGARGSVTGNDQEMIVADGDSTTVLIFRLGAEWLAFRASTVAEVTTPRPIHRVPGRSNHVFAGLVNVEGQVQLCVSLHGLLGITPSGPATRLVVLRDRERGETWVFSADQVLNAQRVPGSQWRSPPTTLANPDVAFSEAIVSWNDRTIGLLDERRIFTALRSLGREQ